MHCASNSPASPMVPVVSTRPGLIEMTTKPSSLSFNAHFLTRPLRIPNSHLASIRTLTLHSTNYHASQDSFTIIWSGDTTTAARSRFGRIIRCVTRSCWRVLTGERGTPLPLELINTIYKTSSSSASCLDEFTPTIIRTRTHCQHSSELSANNVKQRYRCEF